MQKWHPWEMWFRCAIREGVVGWVGGGLMSLKENTEHPGVPWFSVALLPNVQ